MMQIHHATKLYSSCLAGVACVQNCAVKFRGGIGFVGVRAPRPCGLHAKSSMQRLCGRSTGCPPPKKNSNFSAIVARLCNSGAHKTGVAVHYEKCYWLLLWPLTDIMQRQ